MGKVKEMTGVCQGDDGVIAFFFFKKKNPLSGMALDCLIEMGIHSVYCSLETQR